MVQDGWPMDGSNLAHKKWTNKRLKLTLEIPEKKCCQVPCSVSLAIIAEKMSTIIILRARLSTTSQNKTIGIDAGLCLFSEKNMFCSKKWIRIVPAKQDIFSNTSVVFRGWFL